MRSNGGRGLIPEALSPDAAEGRRGEAAAALARPRSYGGTFSIAGASGERLRPVSVMGVSKLVVRLGSYCRRTQLKIARPLHSLLNEFQE
jgi:hypothetical protein